MSAYRTGMDQLMDEHSDLLAEGRVGLVCHPASMNRLFTHSAILLRERLGDRLTCLLGPEHGFYGYGAAGEEIGHDVHPDWRIPIYSLYGDVERALLEMAERVDVVVFDLQDIGVRCYTYVHTLRLILEAARQHGLRVVVTDRAVPHAACVDGPMLDAAFESIIAPVGAPLVYGMTPGETARWLCAGNGIDVPLEVIAARGYRRKAPHAEVWPSWTAPSPAIRSWECAMCFPVTVFTEALPQLDCRRKTNMAFRVLCAEWMNAAALAAAMNARNVPGVLFAPYHDVEEPDAPGIQMRVTEPSRFRPVRTGVILLYEIQQLHGPDRLWRDERTNPSWFDRLMGTDRVRGMLQDGATPDKIADDWKIECETFMESRKQALLYGE